VLLDQQTPYVAECACYGKPAQGLHSGTGHGRYDNRASGLCRPINSIQAAGQDNHYSDPITAMNFCAQGYAKLTDKLRPHIAVLEGGYSIEGALPYVNVGIILALAGIDYSWVREPDYDPGEIRQSDEVKSTIANTYEQLLEQRQQCNARRKKYLEGSELVQRSKTVFYDTDGIMSGKKGEEPKMVAPSCFETALRNLSGKPCP